MATNRRSFMNLWLIYVNFAVESVFQLAEIAMGCYTQVSKFVRVACAFA